MYHQKRFEGEAVDELRASNLALWGLWVQAEIPLMQ